MEHHTVGGFRTFKKKKEHDQLTDMFCGFDHNHAGVPS